MRRLYLAILLPFLLSGCRSDADRMAEFCLRLAQEVDAASDCGDMAARVGAVLDGDQPALRQLDVCEATSACLPCKHAARVMLVRCGTDDAMRPVLDRMHFSQALREYPGQ